MSNFESVPFNKPYFTGLEMGYIEDSFKRGQTSGNGYYTKLCQRFFEEKLSKGALAGVGKDGVPHTPKCLLTTSCTDALEMCAILSGVKNGDEVIIPSYTFVTSALAFSREGAKIVFADSRPDNPNIDESKLEELITPRTKVIVVVHYAGVACEMDKIMEIARRHGIIVVEDCAQAIYSSYNDKPLGTIGDLAAFSFHETKNIQCGEGGLLVVNNEKFKQEAEIVWEKGTNRSQFFRGEVDKYGWVGNGSSFLPSEYTAAFLWGQLQKVEDIQRKRRDLWRAYYKAFKYSTYKFANGKVSVGAEGENVLEHYGIRIPALPVYAYNNAHVFYIVCRSLEQRSGLITYLADNGIHATFHYLSLHRSKYAVQNGWDGVNLPQADKYSNCLLRLPLYNAMQLSDVETVVSEIVNYLGESEAKVAETSPAVV
jgi:dTDP-4-amino-4,6-dideoxygalactose transaminase